MKLIVGLGNPGEKYDKTRHNIGFEAIDYLLKKNNSKLNKEKFNGLFYKTDDYIFAKPLTFMNLSGDFVQKITQFFKIDSSDILVIHDDMDHLNGKITMKPSGSSGGQNGIKDIINKLGTDKIARIKIGIGRGKDATSHVLGKFTSTQRNEVFKDFEKMAQGVRHFINNDLNKAMLTINTK